MRWSILILTQPSRHEHLKRLMVVLAPQVYEYEDVEIKTRMFDPKLSLGENRECLRRASTGEYISFIDDDDLPSAEFVKEIYPLLDGVDYIGFQVQLYWDGEKKPLTYHSLRHNEWHEDEFGFYRDISHLNPMRRELAMAVSMAGGVGEDHRWADELRKLGIVKTEHFIPRVLYHYFFDSTK